MIITGARGFAKEVLEIFAQLNTLKGVAFFDNVNNDAPELLFEQFPVLRTEEEVQLHMQKHGKEFCLGTGNPKLRKKMVDIFHSWGGELASVISPKANIGHFGNCIEKGVSIMSGTTITNDIFIGEGTLINLNCTIGHDTRIEEYVEISPGVHVSGNCQIDAYVTIGTGAVLLPGVRVGEYSIVAAGAVLTKNVEPRTMVAGIPAVEKKKI